MVAGTKYNLQNQFFTTRYRVCVQGARDVCVVLYEAE